MTFCNSYRPARTWGSSPDSLTPSSVMAPGSGILDDPTHPPRKKGRALAYLEDQDGTRHALGTNPITLGRDESNDVSLRSDLRISRTHARLVNREGQWVLNDLGSKNGTFVNGRAISIHPLRDGDQIRIGASIWRFCTEVDPLATAAATDAGALLPRANLTEREVEVLKLVSEGSSDKEIARRLQISVNTVRSHLDRINQKTGLRKRSELTRLALGLDLEARGD